MSDNQQRISELEQEVATLKTQLNSVTEEMLRAYEELNFAYKIAQTFGQNFQLKKVNRQIINLAVEISNPAMGWIFRRKNREIKITLLYNIKDKHAIDISSKFADKLLNSSEPFIINDLSEHIKLVKKWEPRPIAFIGIPLISQQKTLGALCLCKTQKDEIFPTTEAKLLQLLCDHSANIFEKALAGQDILNTIKDKSMTQL